MRSFITDPQGIEDKSMQIIEEILGAKKQQFSPAELAIVKRVIHTTADFEYADLFSASPGAIDAGLKAFKGGNQVVVADTNMIVSGVNKCLLSAYGSKVECLVAVEETRYEA
ncbi:MAG: precorrin-8X methylmutase, partial [Dethiobacteria bacterium]|nr:precorrin-8X methylmutase [Dethiobacteria bacterium]